jgi:hypothetical protein
MLTPNVWALQARNTPDQDFLFKPKGETSETQLPLEGIPDELFY